MFKNVLLGLGLFGLAIASAKTYTITLSEPYTGTPGSPLKVATPL
jgi:hypothetical protein